MRYYKYGVNEDEETIILQEVTETANYHNSLSSILNTVEAEFDGFETYLAPIITRWEKVKDKQIWAVTNDNRVLAYFVEL